MNEQPKALRLANILEHKIPSIKCLEVAAAELRRQHEEIKCEERRFSDLWEQFAALDKKNQELERRFNDLLDRFFKLDLLNDDLVEALEEFLRNPAGDNTEDIARAALAKAKEQA